MAKKSKSKTEKYNIICLSNQLWDFPNWTNKRIVMGKMAKKGHNVLFVDPPINTGRVFLKEILRKNWPLKRLLTQVKSAFTRLTVLSPLNIVPFHSLTSAIHIYKINKVAKDTFSSKRKTILWVYHVQLPKLETYLKKLNYDFLVYDCVDNYAGFPVDKTFYKTVVSKQQLLEQEKRLAQQADIVFATAPGLMDRMQKYNKKTFYTPNVGDYKRFKNTKSYKNKLPKDLNEIPRPRIGMIGALDSYKFDAALVRKCALSNPNISFVLIGPMALKDKKAELGDLGLDGIENIYYLGQRPYERKKFYMAGFDAEMIPYQLNDYTVGGCFPVKFHDSLAAGLPVIVTDLPAYAPFDEVSYISKDYDEFCKNLRLSLREDSAQKIKERQAVAKENDWDGKVKKMLTHVKETIK